MAKCLVCGREINLTRSGIFRRHTRERGVVCEGTSQFPHQQYDTPESVDRKMKQAVGIIALFNKHFGA